MRKHKDLSRPARLCECGEHAWTPLTRGYVTMADPQDIDLLGRNWSTQKDARRGPYAVYEQVGPDGLRFREHLARLIFGAEEREQVDHRDLDSLNNRRRNLRGCTPSQNAANRPQRRDSKQPYKGVHLNSNGTFWAKLSVRGKRLHLGTFDTAESAREAYIAAGKAHHGEFFRDA